jgi:hypothetical protein
MSIHLRQICLVAEKLAPVIDDLKGIFGLEACYIDPGVGTFGLENTLLPVGTDFLEVVAPVEENTAAGRYLARRGGDGGYMVITQVDAHDEQGACKARAAENDVRVAWEREGASSHIMQLHPGDMIASFFEIDWDRNADFEGNWEPAGGMGWRDAVRTDVVSGFRAVELQGPDPEALATLWSRIAGIEFALRDDALVMPLRNVEIRFVEAVDGRGAGLGGIDVSVANRDHVLAEARKRDCYVSDEQVLVCGTRFNLV